MLSDFTKASLIPLYFEFPLPFCLLYQLFIYLSFKTRSHCILAAAPLVLFNVSSFILILHIGGDHFPDRHLDMFCSEQLFSWISCWLLLSQFGFSFLFLCFYMSIFTLGFLRHASMNTFFSAFIMDPCSEFPKYFSINLVDYIDIHISHIFKFLSLCLA